MPAQRWLVLPLWLGLAASCAAAADAASSSPKPLMLPESQPSQSATTPTPTDVAAVAVQSSDCCPESPCCDCLCGPPGRVWVSAEWLYWVASGQPIPALVTASPAGTDRSLAGTLSNPNTVILLGGNRLNDDFRNGFRLRAGFWLDECQTCGIEGDFFFLGRSRQGGAFGSDGSQIIARPFNNALTGQADAQLVSFPNVLSGVVSVDASSDFIAGGFNFVHNLCCSPCSRWDLLAGFRYMNLRDNLQITEDLTALSGSGVAPGTRIVVQDQFRTNNDFYGGLLGLNYERRFGAYFVGLRTSVALGLSHQEITINGATTFTAPGGMPMTFPGGLLAQPSNIGRFTNDEFAVVPEIGVRVGAQLTERLRGFVGYNWIYWSTVSRAGDQIDRNVNPNFLPPASLPVPGPAVPAARTDVTDFWLQGISIGGEFRF